MRRRVLVAQPSPTLQMLIRMTLAAEDLAVECVGDGRSALDSASLSPVPALVIADSALPGLDGYALAEALHRGDATASVPVLLLVPDWERPDVERMLHAGIQDALSKPFEQHALLERVRGLLGPVDGAAAAESEAAPAPATGPPASAVVDAEQLEALAGPALDAAVAEVVERIAVELRTQAQQTLDASVAATVERVLRARARELLEPALRPLIMEVIEPVVWGVVPELAEDIIAREIRRLTEEGRKEP